MKQKIFLAGTVLILAMAVTAVGADITGKWVVERQSAQGTQQTTFDFNVVGGTLTGTVSGGRGGDAEISEGKIDGNDISFAVVNTTGGNEMRTLYRGTISGDEIKFTVERQGGGGMSKPNVGAKSKPGVEARSKPGVEAKSKPGVEARSKPGGDQGGQRGGPQELIAKRAR